LLFMTHYTSFTLRAASGWEMIPLRISPMVRTLGYKSSSLVPWIHCTTFGSGWLRTSSDITWVSRKNPLTVQCPFRSPIFDQNGDLLRPMAVCKERNQTLRLTSAAEPLKFFRLCDNHALEARRARGAVSSQARSRTLETTPSPAKKSCFRSRRGESLELIATGARSRYSPRRLPILRAARQGAGSATRPGGGL
jgi:hypothetical protein